MADESQVSQQQQPEQPQEAKTESSELDYVARREIGREAVWSLSSAKPGNGVDQLRDDSTETYWQSGEVRQESLLPRSKRGWQAFSMYN